MKLVPLENKASAVDRFKATAISKFFENKTKSRASNMIASNA